MQLFYFFSVNKCLCVFCVGQAFLNAVVRKAALRLASRQTVHDSSRPRLLPAAISESLCTAEQQEWWYSVYRVTTNSARFDRKH